MKRPRMSRKAFISITAISGAALALGLPTLDKLRLISKSQILMGTHVNLTLISSQQGSGNQAAEACLAKMAGLEQVLSRHMPSSQVSILNHSGFLVNPHTALKELINQSRELSDLSSGAFDITVKPLQDLYQNTGGAPAPKQVQDVLQLVNYHNLILDENKVRLAKTGMAITLDGIAKGYIVDKGVRLLQLAGFKNVLVEAGGDLTASGEKAHNTPWRIGLQDPRGELGQILTRVKLKNRSLATSGDYLQSYTPDFCSHHIIDPRNGYSSPDFASVSVLANSAALADGLATAVMVMGMDGMELLETLDNTEGYIVKKDGQTHQTSSFF